MNKKIKKICFYFFCSLMIASLSNCVAINPNQDNSLQPKKSVENITSLKISETTQKYPGIEAYLEGKIEFQELSKEAQIEYIRKEQELQVLKLFMNDKRFTREDLIEIVKNQSTLQGIVDAINTTKLIPESEKTQIYDEIIRIKKEYSDIYIPDDVQSMWVFLQDPNDMTISGCRRLADNITKEEFINNFPEYLQEAKEENKQLIITAYSMTRGWDLASKEIIINSKKLIHMTPYTCNGGKIYYGYEYVID